MKFEHLADNGAAVNESVSLLGTQRDKESLDGTAVAAVREACAHVQQFVQGRLDGEGVLEVWMWAHASHLT